MDWKKISHLSQKEIKKLQNKKLRAFMKQMHFHPYYRKLFETNNLSIDEIKTTDDLIKIPFTTKADISASKAEPKKPIDFVLQPSEELLKKYAKGKLIKLFFSGNVKERLEWEYKPVHLHFTTGRTAAPLPFLYSNYDLEQMKEAGRRMMDVFDVGKEEIAVNAFPYAPHLAFWQTYHGLASTNLLALHTGGGKIMGTEKIIQSIQKMQASVLIAMPGYAYHMIRTALELKANFSKIKFVILGGERVSAGLRDKLKELLAGLGSTEPKILSTYALTEGKAAWPECHEGYGYHLYPDMEFIEIINQKTGERVSEGERGEIVYTALDWRGSVVLRYRTGDIGKLIYEKCSCGRTMPRIDPAIDRSSEIKELNLTKIKGTFVNMNLFFPLLMEHKEIDEWQVEIKKKGNDPYEVDELIVYVAPKKGADFIKLKERLKDKLLKELGVTPEIVKVSLRELLQRLEMETELKEKRIIDRRPKI